MWTSVGTERTNNFQLGVCDTRSLDLNTDARMYNLDESRYHLPLRGLLAKSARSRDQDWYAPESLGCLEGVVMDTTRCPHTALVREIEAMPRHSVECRVLHIEPLHVSDIACTRHYTGE